MTKAKLMQYIREYNNTHEGKCVVEWEESSYYVLLANNIGHMIHYYIRKFRTKIEAEEYIKNEPWEEYFGGYTTAKIVSYDYIVKQGFKSLIPKNYYTCE